MASLFVKLTSTHTQQPQKEQIHLPTWLHCIANIQNEAHHLIPIATCSKRGTFEMNSVSEDRDQAAHPKEDESIPPVGERMG